MKTNKLHEKALGLVYDRQSTFEELFDKDKSCSIHQWNLQVLATEMCKIYSHVTPYIMNIFEKIPRNII